MRRVHKQHARWLLVPIQKAVRAPGRGQHGIARTDGHPLASEDRIQTIFVVTNPEKRSVPVGAEGSGQSRSETGSP
jgi:hypothetical protein